MVVVTVVAGMAAAVMPVVTADMAADTGLATTEAVIAVDAGLATLADVILPAATMLTSVRLTQLGASGFLVSTGKRGEPKLSARKLRVGRRPRAARSS